MRESVSWMVPFVLSVGLYAQADSEPDRDGDGLSDFHEVHKYRTDPEQSDSDGDGVPDGDWLERREFQYTVRAVVHVMRPVTIEYLCDDYQDVRVLDETASHVELEVILYPFNSVAREIRADKDWRTKAKAMARWTEPGPTNDWTPRMRKDLVALLLQDGIDVDKLDDRTLVEKTSRWLCRRAAYHDGFSTFVTSFDEDGKPFVTDELMAGVKRGEREKGLTLEEQWQREVSARGMFRHLVRGSCSSSAIYLNGCLRALGVPTRTVLCIPIVDANDDSELRMLERLRHRVLGPKVRKAIDGLRGSWASHTFNEVFVGERWRRLNYDRLGQNIYDPGMFGLMIHTATFSDWADAKMPETIGKRQKGGSNDDVFGGPNPYSTIALRDEFGVHCTFKNPEVAEVQEGVAVTAVNWGDDETLRRDVRDWFVRNEVFGLVATIEGIESAEQLADFMETADLRVYLHAEDCPRLGIGFDKGNWWWDGERAQVVVPFGLADRRDLVLDTPYKFAPRNNSKTKWLVAPGVEARR